MTLHLDSVRWSIRNQIDYILCSQRWTDSIQSAKKRPGADFCSDHEVFIAKVNLKLKKVGKTTRQFRYDLNQILHYCMVVSEELWTEVHNIIQEAVTKPSPRKRDGGRQTGCLRRLYK